MLSRLHFDVAGAPARPAPARADVACFVGRVARRAGAPLRPEERRYLEARGWGSREGATDPERRRLAGPWELDPERLASLLHVPVVVESWAAFHRLFAWEARPLRDGGEARCATWLGAAVRSFFAYGGRRAVVVRTGDPWPYLGGEEREARRDARMAELLPFHGPAARPFDPADPTTWRGIEHLYALGEVSHLCLPDLADLCATEPPPPEVEREPPPPPELFVECSGDEPTGEEDDALARVMPPRLALEGIRAWGGAVSAAREFLAQHRRDALLVAALPLLAEGIRAPAAPAEGGDGTDGWADPLRFFETVGILEAPADPAEAGPTAASAFVQLVWPWVRTLRAGDLPSGLEPADGLFTGLLAANALGRGTFRSVAGSLLPGVVGLEPEIDAGPDPGSPAALLAARVCLVGPEPEGHVLLSDVTGSRDPAWRPGGVSRLVAAVLRAARRTGESELFEPSGPETWRRVRRNLERLLEGFFRAGGLRGAHPGEAFEVRCDRTTMSRNDLDHGRIRAEITLLPAAPVERITVSLELTAGRAGASLPEVA